MTAARLALALALCAAVPPGARAHGVEYAHEVEQREGRVAVRFRSAHGGKPLARAWVQVFAPADPREPRETGRTDAAGRYEFRPDAPGTWRVRAVDATGHGAVAKVEVTAAGAPPAAAPAPAAATPPAAAPAAPASGGSAPDGGPRAAAPRIRVFAWAAAIAIAFALLAAFHRRRRPRV